MYCQKTKQHETRIKCLSCDHCKMSGACNFPFKWDAKPATLETFLK